MTKSPMTLPEMLASPQLFGAMPQFADLSSRGHQLVFIKAVYGLPMSAAEVEIYRHHTHRSTPRPGGHDIVAGLWGRRSGKTELASAMVGFEGLRRPAGRLRTGKHGIIVAQDQRASVRNAFGAACEPFEVVPSFAMEVLRQTADTLELANGYTISGYPCRPHALRGLDAGIVVLDEPCFYISTEGRMTDFEMVRAALPTLATSRGRLILISSPYGSEGLMYEWFEKYFGNDDADTLVWKASSIEMNPCLDADHLAQLRRLDPESYRNEFEGEFRSGIGRAFDPDALERCVESGVRERPVTQAQVIVAGTDVASGSGKDAMATAIAYGDADQQILAALRVWRPPFNPSEAIRESAAFIQSWGLDECVGDKYSPGFVSEGFRKHGIEYRAEVNAASAVYLEALPLINSGSAVLLDHPDLLREMRQLERRTGGQRDKITHGSGKHDDVANAACVALATVATRGGAPLCECGQLVDGQPCRGWHIFGGGDPTRPGEDFAAMVERNSSWFPGD